MLSFSPEWSEAPGVKDPVLAATWARFEISASAGPSVTSWPSRLVHLSTSSVRQGIYGPLFPLAEWVVENWWFLLHEPCRVPSFASGRSLTERDPSQRPWLQRHCLLAAREGGALPDLSVYRDGSLVAVKWAADPQQDAACPVRFIDEGEIRLPAEDVERSLHALVESVLERLSGDNQPDAVRLRSEWAAVCRSRQAEPDVCAWAASLGIDPYADDGLTDDLVTVFESELEPLPEGIRRETLEASDRNSIANDARWVSEGLRRLDAPIDAMPNDLSYTARQAAEGISAHLYGYKCARQFRERIGLGTRPPDSMTQCAQQWLGAEIDLSSPTATSIDVLVGRTGAGKPAIIGSPAPFRSTQFHLGRAVYFLADARNSPPSPRLVTRAHTWDQRASRAFAAELLAPADFLRQEVQGSVSAENVDRLAGLLNVSPMLVEHQLNNHGIAWVEEG